MELVTGATARAGNWTLLASEFSAWADPGFEPDESIVRAIRREFDPEFLLLWVRRIYRTPGGNVIKKGYHHIARHIRYPDRLGKIDAEFIKGLARPLRGWPASFNEGRIYECGTLEGPVKPGGAPADYKPVERWLYNDFKKQWWETRVRERGVEKYAAEASTAQINTRAKNIAAVQDKARMAARDDKHLILKAVEKDLNGELPPAPPGPKVSVVVPPTGSTPVKES